LERSELNAFRSGFEYVVAHSQPPSLFLVHRRDVLPDGGRANVSAVYFVLEGKVYPTPTLFDVMAVRLVSPASYLCLRCHTSKMVWDGRPRLMIRARRTPPIWYLPPSPPSRPPIHPPIPERRANGVPSHPPIKPHPEPSRPRCRQTSISLRPTSRRPIHPQSPSRRRILPPNQTGTSSTPCKPPDHRCPN